MSIFSTPGWALPIRKIFRYSYEQKMFLFNIFKEGEETGKKMSPDQTHMKMREQFPVSQYVTAEQIKSLFSRWSCEQRKGILKEPKRSQKEEEVYTTPVQDKATLDNDVIRGTTCSVMTVIMDLECSKWVMVLYDGDIFPGIIKQITSQKVTVQCMEYEMEGKNCFRWPNNSDISDYEYEFVICKIDAPEITGVSTKNKRKDIYSISNTDWEEACKFCDN